MLHRWRLSARPGAKPALEGTSTRSTNRVRAREILLEGVLCLGWVIMGTSGCCVSPPTSQELLEVGFRTPEQTFRTFQTASAGQLAHLEYRCLSLGFRSRNDLSRLKYLTFRDEWLKSEPLLRYAIDRAEITSVQRPDGSEKGVSRCRLLARTLRRTLSIELVREEFYEIWTEDGLIDSRDLDFDGSTGIQDSGSESWFYGQVPLPAGFDGAEVSDLSLRREWKIDHFELVEKSEPKP